MFTDFLPELHNIDIEGQVIQHKADIAYRYRRDPWFQDTLRPYSMPYYDVNTLPRVDPQNHIDIYIQFIIMKCWDLYHNNDFIRSAIDVMVDLSHTELKMDTDDKSREFFEEWLDEIDIDQLLDWILLEYYISSNVYIYANIDQSKYTVLNSMLVKAHGSLIDNNLEYRLRVPANREEDVLNNLSLTLEQKRNVVTKNEYILDNITPIYRKKQPYQRYATPFLTPLFKVIGYKERLREADISLANSIINQLIIIKVGNDKYFAKLGTLKKVSELLSDPSSFRTLVWNHAIDMQVHQPDPNLFAKEKYEQVDKEIFDTLGIGRVVISGEGTNVRSAWIATLTLMKKLESGRRDILRWLKKEAKKIAKENGVEVPKFRFEPINLVEERVQREVYNSLYDRGAMSWSTFVDTAGFDPETELNNKKKERKIEDLIAPPPSAFQRSRGQPNPNNQGRPPSIETQDYSPRKEELPNESPQDR